jgi:hypothetical protein
VLYPQDFIYLTGAAGDLGLSLFLFTAVAGRLWCGYACPQTVYTEIFMWIERKIEGDRAARMKRDEGPMTADKALAQRRQAPGLDGHRPVDRLHLRRLLHAHPHAGREVMAASAWALGDLLGPVLRLSPPTAMPASCASRCASTCAPTRASRARCSTRTR